MMKTFLTALLALGVTVESEARWATVSGKVVFEDGEPAVFPAVGGAPTPALTSTTLKDAVLVSVIIRPEGSPHVMAGATDSRGEFSVPVLLRDGHNFSISLEVNNVAVHVMADTDGANEFYEKEVWSGNAGHSGDVAVGQITILVNPPPVGLAIGAYETIEVTERAFDAESIMVSFAGALNINSIILGVREDIIAHRGLRPDTDTIGPVSLEYCDEAWNSFFADIVLTCASMNGAKHLDGLDYGFVDQTIAHEYTHHLQYEIGTSDFHSGRHRSCEEIDSGVWNDPEFAWSEGFADFISLRTVFKSRRLAQAWYERPIRLHTAD